MNIRDETHDLSERTRQLLTDIETAIGNQMRNEVDAECLLALDKARRGLKKANKALGATIWLP